MSEMMNAETSQSQERPMVETRSRKLFVNLAVRDLKKSMDFFSQLGFTFNPKFTDENAACMILSSEGYVMLLREPYFKSFTNATRATRPGRTKRCSRCRATAARKWTTW